MTAARLVSLGHLKHVGTLTGRQGEPEKDLEGRVPMGACWIIISSLVDECGYAN